MIIAFALGILSISLILGYIKYLSISSYDSNNKEFKNNHWSLKFTELWNDCVNFFIPGVIAYYFVLIRWPSLLIGKNLNFVDVFLLLVFTMGLFGHLSVMSNNITKSVEAILNKYVGK